MYRPMGFGSMPPVVKNLLIANVIIWLAQMTLPWITNAFALYNFHSPHFKPYQLFTYMFLHSTRDMMHILFNMLALWMFGSQLERVWGSARFFIFYILCGLGAGVLNIGISFVQNIPYTEVLPTIEQGIVPFGMDQAIAQEVYDRIMAPPTVGASGAIFGCLAAFAYLFPNDMILVWMIPMRAKWFVLIYAGIELFSGILNQPGDNVAHWAHLGGALVGFLIVLFWNRTNRRNFY